MIKNEKVFVIDTNLILNDYMIPFTFRDCTIVLPQTVIKELDRKLTFEDKSVAYNARAFCRKIKNMIKEQGSSDLIINETTKLIIIPTDVDKLNKTSKHLGLDSEKADSEIVSTAYLLSKDNDVTMLTNDTNMWVTCVAIGLKVEDYEVNKQFQDVYSGVKTILVDDDPDLITRVYNGESTVLTEDLYPGLFPNQILVFKTSFSTQSSLITYFKNYNTPLKKISSKENFSFAGIKPINKEQSFAYELLDKEHISCVSLAGRAGTGKSIIALSYAISCLDGQVFEKITILKPVIPVGKDLGFLPGTLEEKLEPWMESFKDSLDVIFKSDKQYVKDEKTFKDKTYNYLIESGKLEFKPLTHMRGRSIQNTLIILDEAQNCSIHEIKTLLTRISEGSMVIALGDIEQIDAPWLNQQNNGLSYLIERGKSSELIGHITFIKSCRSELADWASTNL